MKHLNRRVWIASVAVMAACANENETPGDNPVTAAPNVVSLTATDYAIEAPDTVPAGWTTLRMANHGGDLHYGHVVGLEPGKTVQDLVNAYAEAIRTSGPRPKWVKRFGGPGGTTPGGSSSVTQYLEPGSYVWICPIEDSAGMPHFSKGEFKPFVVRATNADASDRAAAPEASVFIRLTDYSFELAAPLPSGKHTVRVENAGVEPHDLALLKLAPGKTLEDVQKWMNPERARRDNASEPAPPLESLVSGVGGVAAMAPGMQSFFETEFTPGEYVLMCMATAPDGRSHIEHGMVRQITVQ